MLWLAGQFFCCALQVLLARACVTFVPAFANQYYGSCAVGFSAVLFAMKVVLNSNSPGWSSVAGISLPTKVSIMLVVACVTDHLSQRHGVLTFMCLPW